MGDVSAAIATIEASRLTHVKWRDHWLAVRAYHDGAECPRCEREAKVAGDLAHHERCIAEYDNVLEVLRAVPSSA